ncbi:MAG: DUF3267 domain-containing protein [Chloroflexi bacterium]|jgi:hypothetical protein|nr:DUF3267 domain-containing protein [Chloroflexota bacterium]
MASRLGVADFQDDQRFVLLDRLDHQDLMPFIVRYYIKEQGPVLWAHYLLTLASLAAWAATLIGQGASRNQGLIQSVLAVLFFFVVLLPLHEAVHGLVYWLLGARDVRFSASVPQAYVYAIAHHFVADRRAFLEVALAPSLVINGLLLVAWWLWPPARLGILAALFFHISGTSGDFALINYYWANRGRTVYTYDDAETRQSFFFADRRDAAGA